ncbi:glycoside hydrolase family 3 protein [Anopheles sinensis]|uniref:Glycoside hydrolase family 3 protein n=1 Tax=Anopheles sinensis TaxID=74873 RepID=A0A084W0E0_ANOSI|nr:glycoside hydrolase family 3 protein [Anopheles sinensis]
MFNNPQPQMSSHLFYATADTILLKEKTNDGDDVPQKSLRSRQQNRNDVEQMEISVHRLFTQENVKC